MTAEAKTTAARGRSLLGRISLIYALTLAVSSAVLFGGGAAFLSWKAERDLSTEGARLASWLETAFAKPLWNYDLNQISAVAQGLVLNGTVLRVGVRDNDGNLVFDLGNHDAKQPSFTGNIRFRDQLIGDVEVELSRKAFSQARTDLVPLVLILLSLLVLVIIGTAGLFLRRSVRSPLDELSGKVERYAQGEYRSLEGLDLSYREFARVSLALSTMGRLIREQMERWRELNDHLEEAVTARTRDLGQAKDELESTLTNLKIAQDSLIRSEKLASLGKLVADLAHELNTPLGAITSSVESMELALVGDLRFLFADLASEGPGLEDLFDEALASAKNLGAMPERAALRSWRSTLATEGLDENARERVLRLVEDCGLWPIRERLVKEALVHGDSRTFALLEIATSAARALSLVKSATSRAAGVVKALRIHLREEHQGTATEIDIDAALDSVLLLFGSRLSGDLTLRRDYVPGLKAWGSIDLLNQVWMNLIVNAIHAMDGSGVLTVRTRGEGAGVSVEIEDSGHGVPADIRTRIFEPFFTTKGPGEGMGLGLDICKRIVEDQGGSIDLESVPGRTVFRVLLPSSLAL